MAIQDPRKLRPRTCLARLRTLLLAKHPPYNAFGTIAAAPAVNTPALPWCTAFHANMTAAIPLGRKADGNGLWWPASYYTEATMLAAIGDSTRIVPGPGQLLSPWILQQEKFLDKLDIWGQEFHYLFTNKTMYGDTSPWGELLFSEDREDSRWVARGTNTRAWVDAVLHESWAYTYADDLCMYIDPLPISTSSGGLMQCGGFSNFMATQRYAWANGGSDLPGTTVKDNRSYTTGVTFSVASGNHRAGYLGNGYLSVGAAGRWSGEIIFIGLPLFDTSLIP